MEIYTRRLEPGEIVSQFDATAALFRQFGCSTIEVSFGWGCQLDIDGLWQPQSLPTDGLAAFVQETLSRGIYLIGDSDRLFVRSPAP